MYESGRAVTEDPDGDPFSSGERPVFDVQNVRNDPSVGCLERPRRDGLVRETADEGATDGAIPRVLISSPLSEVGDMR
jgi:hypothetical protein